VERRVEVRRGTLAEAEDRLAVFLRANGQFENSSELNFQFERLKREVPFCQRVLVGHARSVEEASIREVRDVPVITVIEAPSLSVRPNPQRRPVRDGLGVMAGGLLAALSTLAGAGFASRGARGEPNVFRFAVLVRESAGDFARWAGRGPQEASISRSSSPPSFTLPSQTDEVLRRARYDSG
jgi:hypothetical protein